jgi:multiple sugar transport system permease protein
METRTAGYIKLKSIMRLIFTYAVLLFGIALILLPLVWMVTSSFKPTDKVYEYPPRLWSPDASLDSYRTVLREHPFARYILNSVIVAGSVTIVASFLHAMAAYALSRFPYRWLDFIFLFMLVTMMIPEHAVIIPRFLLVRALGWFDSYAALIIPSIPHAFGIFALRQFMVGIPIESEEAAILDGCSRWTIFIHVILPLSRGIMITLAVLYWVFNWDAFLWPLIVTNSEKMRVVQLGIAYFFGDYITYWDRLLAAATMGALPSILIFLLLQRYLVRGVSRTGLKF